MILSSVGRSQEVSHETSIRFVENLLPWPNESSDDRPPHALKVPVPNGAEFTLTENTASPFHAEPPHASDIVLALAVPREARTGPQQATNFPAQVRQVN